MRSRALRMDVYEAMDDLKRHTLAALPGEIGKLLYLASTRDYSTGRYYHDGLASNFNEDIASRALAICHQEIFDELVAARLEDLVAHVEKYAHSLPANRNGFFHVWKRLEPYRVTIPLDSNPLSARLFFSNVKIALAILESREAVQSH